MRCDPALIVVVGATASGKTDLALRLAGHLGTEILSADSRQLYRGMPIGTAQPDAQQLARVRHHFIACRDASQPYNAGRYEADAIELLGRLFPQYGAVVAVGGSGLYIDALCEGMDELPAADPALREELARRLAAEGAAPLLAELQRRDPLYYEQVDRANPARVLRALEVCIRSGRPYSELRSGEKRQRDFRILKLGIAWEREELYARIDRRVEEMIRAGLEAEARALYPLRHLNALQTVGYREMFEYFDGQGTLADAVERIKRNTRRYAKRQMTWFRRDPRIRWFPAGDLEPAIRWVESELLRDRK